MKNLKILIFAIGIMLAGILCYTSITQTAHAEVITTGKQKWSQHNLQCKIFDGNDTQKIEKDINIWLKKTNGHIIVKKKLQSESMSRQGYNLTITIFYEQ